jgi:CHASE2 domain-containing sensor protein
MPFHQVRLAQLYGDNPVSLRPPHLAPGEPFVVLVGNVMPSLHDYHPTPLYGQVAGVYLHAGALANLERHGKNYIKETDLTYLNWLALIVAVSLCMCSVWLGASKAGDVAQQESLLLKFWGKLKIWLLDVTVLLLLYIAFYYFLRATPEGWLSLIALLPFLREVVIAGESEYRKKRDQHYESNPYLASDNTQC